MKLNKSFFNRLLYLPWTIIFNFHYLPFKQAIKLPIVFYTRPSFLIFKGKVIIDAKVVRPNMIRLGTTIVPLIPRCGFIWENDGTILFHGDCVIASASFVSCRSGKLEFGKNNSFSSNNRIICYNSICFEDKIRVSWDCTFMDTDLHPLIDMVTQHEIPMKAPIKVGYGSWIGHNCIVSKGSKLPKNTTVSSGSIVKGKFKKENTIIAGNLATVIDEGYVRDDV